MEQRTQTFAAILAGADRLLNSGDGNPSWSIVTDAGRFRTGREASINYDIANHTEVREDSPDNWIGKRVKFTATMAGGIIGWELAE